MLRGGPLQVGFLVLAGPGAHLRVDPAEEALEFPWPCSISGVNLILFFFLEQALTGKFTIVTGAAGGSYMAASMLLALFNDVILPGIALFVTTAAFTAFGSNRLR